MKIFRVGEDEKCGCCNWRVPNVYLIAETREEAEELYKENDRGLCADCLVELIIEYDWEILERPNVERLKQTFIEDLEHIKTLLENYNEGKGKLAEIWNFINARLEVYKLEE